MFLIFETGNTSTSIAIRDDKEVKYFYKILDTEISNDDDFNGVINNLLSINNIEIKDIKKVLISSVVRRAKDMEINFCKKNNLEFFDISDDNIKLNFTKRKGMGADLIANTFNAIDLYKQDIIVIDMGTATTFTTIEKDMVGAAFIAGFKTVLDSLSNNCDLLPSFEFKKPKSVLGKNTVEAMNAGVYFGYIGIIKGIVSRIEEELNKKMKVILTGGYSKLIIDKLDFDVKYIQDLTIEGIYKTYKYNNEV